MRWLLVLFLTVALATLLPPQRLSADDDVPKRDAPQPASAATSLGPADPKQKAKPGPIDEDAPQEWTRTKSGLKYRVLRKGKGPKPGERDNVVVHYKGWLDDGTIFGSSYRSGETTTFPLVRVMKGWTEGLQQIGAGGMIALEVPPQLGYGARGKKGEIPPNARLHFIIELFAIQPAFKVF